MRWYVTSTEKLFVPVVGLAGVNPPKCNSCLPGVRGCRNTYHQSATACVGPTGEPKTLLVGIVKLNKGEVILYLSSCCKVTPSTDACKLVVAAFCNLAHCAKSDSVFNVGFKPFGHKGQLHPIV